MKRLTFYLVSSVIAVQLALVTALTVACILHDEHECIHGETKQYLAFILAQTLFLYAAEARMNIGNDQQN